MRVELVSSAFDPAALLGAFTARAEGAGGVVSFTGHARGTNRVGDPIDALVLETYRGMTQASMEKIVQDAYAGFPITQAHVVHRYGRITPGEAIVFVAAASAHRRAAFDAADYMMDRLKTEAIFWKREVGPKGNCWIEPTEADHLDVARWATKQDDANARN